MRARWAATVLFVAIVMLNVGKAQVYQFATPPPQVNASAAWWQIESVAIQFNGVVYVPTGLVRPFDGNVMTQIGAFDQVPVYADATLEPFSILYVPVARGMRAYERERNGDLSGTTGSQAPAMPVQPVSAPTPRQAASLPPPSAVATSGTPTPVVTNVTRTPVRTRVETIPQPRTSDGVWILYDGARWYSDGEAVPYTPERFARIGSYHGFPVYRDRNRDAHAIWVAVVQDGPVAPYAKR